MNRRKRTTGFTLVEVLVVSPIIVIAIGAFLFTIVSLTGEVLSSRAQSVLAQDTQLALSRINRDVRMSSQFLATNTFTPASPQGLDDNDQPFVNVNASGHNSVIIEKVATTSNPIAPPTSYIYLEDAPSDCSSPFLRQNTPLTINVVYFVSEDSSLWRRVLLPPDYQADACAQPWQQPSCSPDNIDDDFCLTEDEKLLDGVTEDDFGVTYYTRGEEVTPLPDASNPATPEATRAELLEQADAVEISIRAEQTAAGRTVEWESQLFMTRQAQ